MTVTIETLEKLERKVSLSLPIETIQNEVDLRLKKLAKQVKIDGFRPGKVPMNIVAQRYGYSVQYEVMNDKVGEAFAEAAQQANLRVAGAPKIVEKENADEGQFAFDAVFEIYPEVEFGDLSQVEVEKFTAHVNQEAIDKTIDILKKQRRTFTQKAMDQSVANDDRVTVDFEGKVDGEPFQGGQATDFQFVVGEGQMLKEFESAVLGMKLGESKTFPLSFPENYHGKDVAGKVADFMVSLKKIEASHLPELNEAFVKSLGVTEATVEGLRSDIEKNLQREVKSRLLNKNKQVVLDALVKQAKLDLPKSIVQSELDRMVENARAELKQRGIKDADSAPIPEDIFRPQAEQRVRMGLVVSELVRLKDLYAKPEQIKEHIEHLASSYERPEEVMHWYFNDKRNMAEVEALVVEENVTQYVLSQLKVKEKELSFDELMGQ
jgi:trigger factor